MAWAFFHVAFRTKIAIFSEQIFRGDSVGAGRRHLQNPRGHVAMMPICKSYYIYIYYLILLNYCVYLFIIFIIFIYFIWFLMVSVTWHNMTVSTMNILPLSFPGYPSHLALGLGKGVASSRLGRDLRENWWKIDGKSGMIQMIRTWKSEDFGDLSKDGDFTHLSIKSASSRGLK